MPKTCLTQGLAPKTTEALLTKKRLVLTVGVCHHVLVNLAAVLHAQNPASRNGWVVAGSYAAHQLLDAQRIAAVAAQEG
jgi:hypothetical protein